MTTRRHGIGRTWIGVALGVFIIVLLVAMPLVLTPNSAFVGTDNAGSDVIEQLAPAYDSGWIRNWWSPPGAETESMLFALQATVGGLLVGYAFGYFRGRKSVMPANIAALSDDGDHQ